MASTAITTLQNSKAAMQRFEKKLTAPSTPSIKQLLSTSTPQSASPGRWRHPELATLASRQKRNSFDSSNVWTMLANVIALLVTWQWRDALSHLSPSLTSWPHWPLIEWCFTGVYLYNIYRAGRPAFKPADNAADVDLTAGQRALLGLDPNATPPETPSTKYITPPRYARSAGSSASGASRGSPASYGSISSLGGSFGSSRAASVGSAWSSPRSVSGGSLLVADGGAGSGAGGGAGGATGSGGRVGGSLLHRLHERRRSSLSYSRQSPINVPTYGDPDAWLDSISGTPPRREEWRFVPNEPLGVSAGSTAIPPSRPALKHSNSYSQSYSTSYSQPYPNTNTSSKALLPYGGSGSGAGSGAGSAAVSGRSSPLGLSLEGTGLWASTGSGSGGAVGKGSASGGGSVFRPDTPSPIGARPANVGVPLTSRWVYERGREEGRF